MTRKKIDEQSTFVHRTAVYGINTVAVSISKTFSSGSSLDGYDLLRLSGLSLFSKPRYAGFLKFAFYLFIFIVPGIAL